MAKDLQVTVTYVTKINMGDYNSQHLGIEIVSTVKDVGEADLLWEQAKESVENQAQVFYGMRNIPQTLEAVSTVPVVTAPAPVYEPPSQEPQAVEQEEFDVEYIMLAHTKKGDPYLKVFCGPFMKYGISFWDNYIEKNEWGEKFLGWANTYELGKQYQLPEPYTKAVVETAGKSKKVVALR